MNGRVNSTVRQKLSKLQLFAIMGVLLASCGLNRTTGPSATCGTGTAQIQVYDGALKRICGCAESSNASFSSGQSLVCTVSAGTKLYIDFVGIQNTHQIVISGVASTPPRSASATSVQTDVIQLNNTGTFTFQDFFYPTFGGSIIVN